MSSCMPRWQECQEDGDVSQVLIPTQTGCPNSYRLMKSPITRSCMRSVLEKHSVRRTSRLIRVRRLMCLLSIFGVFSLPTWRVCQTCCFGTLSERQNKTMGLCSHRETMRISIEHEINTCETPSVSGQGHRPGSNLTGTLRQWVCGRHVSLQGHVGWRLLADAAPGAGG